MEQTKSEWKWGFSYFSIFLKKKTPCPFNTFLVQYGWKNWRASESSFLWFFYYTEKGFLFFSFFNFLLLRCDMWRESLNTLVSLFHYMKIILLYKNIVSYYIFSYIQ